MTRNAACRRNRKVLAAPAAPGTVRQCDDRFPAMDSEVRFANGKLVADATCRFFGIARESLGSASDAQAPRHRRAGNCFERVVN